EGLSGDEVGKEIAAHRAHAAEHGPDRGRSYWLTITEAVLLSVVAVVAAYSGYSAAQWNTHASVELATAAADRTKANRADLKGWRSATSTPPPSTPGSPPISPA